MDKHTTHTPVAYQCHRMGWTFVDRLIVVGFIAFLFAFLLGAFE